MICPDNTLPTFLLMPPVETLAPTLQLNQFKYLKGNLRRDVNGRALVSLLFIFVVHDEGSRSIVLWQVLVLVLVLVMICVSVVVDTTATCTAAGGLGGTIRRHR